MPCSQGLLLQAVVVIMFEPCWPLWKLWLSTATKSSTDRNVHCSFSAVNPPGNGDQMTGWKATGAGIAFALRNAEVDATIRKPEPIFPLPSGKFLRHVDLSQAMAVAHKVRSTPH